jgi:hypothetical protein
LLRLPDACVYLKHQDPSVNFMRLDTIRLGVRDNTPDLAVSFGGKCLKLRCVVSPATTIDPETAPPCIFEQVAPKVRVCVANACVVLNKRDVIGSSHSSQANDCWDYGRRGATTFARRMLDARR